VVWFERARVGTLTKASDGGVSSSYDPAWLAADTAFPVASALSLTRSDWKGDPVVAALDNLLPDAEGQLREKIATRISAEGKDVFSLLSAPGRDCVGALQLVAPDQEPADLDMDFREISADEMLADLKNLAVAPLALGDDKDFGISIAGAQEKTAYLRVGNHWAKPRGHHPHQQYLQDTDGYSSRPWQESTCATASRTSFSV